MSAEERETVEHAAPAEEGNGVGPPRNGMAPAIPETRAGQPGGMDGGSGVRGAVAEIPSEEEFLRLNQRRTDLIRKQTREGLTADEAAEFTRLDAAAAAYVNHHHPLPTLHLREIEDLARRFAAPPPPPGPS